MLGLAAGLGAGPARAKDPALLSLTMEHFRDTATVKEDPLGAMATISTENGFVERKGLMGMVWNDEYLRGVVDEKTDQKSFQVYAMITYRGNWRFYQSASYQTSGGPRSVPLAQIGKESDNCAVGECIYTERVAFAIDEGLLRQLASENTPGKPSLWHYKLIAKQGPEYVGGISSAEVAGFLAKVDDYSHALPAVKASAAGTSLKLDLGIGGMPVAATAEYPNRAGILVIDVNRGSVAQKAGIIIGDIVTEVDGRPIKMLTDLQAAVAARAANSAAAIKLYRGTTEMTVTARF
jgi:PDZ domain-containing protein